MSPEFIALAVLFLAREVSFQVSTHKLMNKLMSRNYYDYEITQKTRETKPKEQMGKIRVEEELGEDLAPLNDFGLN